MVGHNLTVRALRTALLSLLLTGGLVPPAGADDVPAYPAAPLLAQSNTTEPCSFAALGSPLALMEAVSRALCRNPKTRGAWASIKLNAADVRIAKESYLPTLAGTAKELDSSTATRIKDAPILDTNAHDTYPSGSFSLSWVLFDFGQRGDQVEAARQLLEASRANLDLNLQQVFLQTAADYYDTQAGMASLDSAREIEELAQRNVGAAHVRVERGVAPISDELQAQTAYAQAVVNRVKAEEQLQSKRGALGIDMGLDPDSAMTLPPPERDINAGGDFAAGLHELIEEAKRTHPSVVLAEHELAAARADEKAARAHGYPTISLVGGISRSNEPLTPSLGSPTIPGHVSNRSVGIEIDVPISDPLWKRGVIAKARAQVQAQEETLYGTEQQVAQDVWSVYTTLKADTDNVVNAEKLLQAAQKSFEATQRRYEGGAGNILELLSAQSAYASAQQQHIQAQSDWRIARLALSASLGRLRLSSVEEKLP
jgi:outer membrane protein